MVFVSDQRTKFWAHTDCCCCCCILHFCGSFADMEIIETGKYLGSCYLVLNLLLLDQQVASIIHIIVLVNSSEGEKKKELIIVVVRCSWVLNSFVDHACHGGIYVISELYQIIGSINIALYIYILCSIIVFTTIGEQIEQMYARIWYDMQKKNDDNKR